MIEKLDDFTEAFLLQFPYPLEALSSEIVPPGKNIPHGGKWNMLSNPLFWFYEDTRLRDTRAERPEMSFPGQWGLSCKVDTSAYNNQSTFPISDYLRGDTA